MAGNAVELARQKADAIRAKAEENRKRFPFAARMIDELRACDNGEDPPFEPRLIYASENGEHIGKPLA